MIQWSHSSYKAVDVLELVPVGGMAWSGRSSAACVFWHLQEGPVGHAAPVGHLEPVMHLLPVGHPVPVAQLAPVMHLTPVVHAAPVVHVAPVGHLAPVGCWAVVGDGAADTQLIIAIRMTAQMRTLKPFILPSFAFYPQCL